MVQMKKKGRSWSCGYFWKYLTIKHSPLAKDWSKTIITC